MAKGRITTTAGVTPDGNEYVDYAIEGVAARILAQVNPLGEWHVYYVPGGRSTRPVRTLGAFGKQKDPAVKAAHVAASAIVAVRGL